MIELYCIIYVLYYVFDFYFHPQTALHWAAKHGNMDLVKMLAGTYGANVNVKTVSKVNMFLI